MSIWDLIVFQTGDDQKQLFWLEPALPNEEVIRYMLVSEEVRDALVGTHSSAMEQKRFGQLRGDLDAFLEGRRISVALHPYKKHKAAYIARVDPVEDEIWDIRSIDPSPGIRVLGCFAETDLFVALVWEYREDLDGPGGKLWEAFIQRAKQQWKKNFLTLSPASGSDISDYISSNYFAV